METSRLLSRQKIQFFCLNLGSSFRFEKPLNVAECPCGQVSMWPSVCFHKACGRVSMWPSVHVVECPCGQVSMWPSDCVAKCLCGRMSVWPNVCMAERHVAEWHVAECHVAECLWAHFKCLVGHIKSECNGQTERKIGLCLREIWQQTRFPLSFAVCRLLLYFLICVMSPKTVFECQGTDKALQFPTGSLY